MDSTGIGPIKRTKPGDSPRSPDRIWCTTGVKMNMGDYESAETAAQALARAIEVIDLSVVNEAHKIRKGKFRKVLR